MSIVDPVVTDRALIKGCLMSKRKNKNQSSNIPQTTLDRAQQQVDKVTDAVEDVAAKTTNQALSEAEETADEVGFTPKSAGVTPLTPPARRVRAVRTAPVAVARTPTNRNAAPKKDPKTDTAYIRNRLANPTRMVTEAELRAEYSYVAKDLRTMGVLAAVLIGVLFVLARFL